MGFDPISLGKTAIGVAGNLLGDKNKTDAATIARQRQQQAYQEALARGKTMGEEGEKQFLDVANSDNPYLTQVGKDIKGQGTETMQDANRQMQAQLAQQGVRGGQAATQLARQSGKLAENIQSDLTQSQSQDLANKQAQKMAYFQSKSGRGQSAYLAPSVGPA
jgi:hypothetical protein